MRWGGGGGQGGRGLLTARLPGRFIERAWRRHKRVRMENVLRQIRARTGEAVEELRLPMIVIHCAGGINRSPAVLIYWLYRYACGKARSTDTDYEMMWRTVQEKRANVFWKETERRGVCPVLEKKDCWMDQIKQRVDKEKSQDKYKDLLNPFVGAYKQAQCKKELGLEPGATDRRLSTQDVLMINCGGVPGSPFSDSDD